MTDQTSAHDPLNGYIPIGYSVEEAAALRKADPDKYMTLAKQSMAKHVDTMLTYLEQGSIVFDYGNNIRQVAKDEGIEKAFRLSWLCASLYSPIVL